MIHTGEKPYKCMYVPRCLVKIHTLQISHTGDVMNVAKSLVKTHTLLITGKLILEGNLTSVMRVINPSVCVQA